MRRDFAEKRVSAGQMGLAPLDRFLGRVLRRLKLGREAVSVCLVTGRAIAGWNRAYRGKPRPTDVLSFPANQRRKPERRPLSALRNGDRPRGYLGDVAIAPAVALRNAREAGRSLDEELRVLVLHGVLHLLGYDHEADGGEMERVETRLRREFGLN